jgi:hypothetical protein
MQKKSKSTQKKSFAKKKLIVEVRDLKPRKDAKGGAKGILTFICDIKGES